MPTAGVEQLEQGAVVDVRVGIDEDVVPTVVTVVEEDRLVLVVEAGHPPAVIPGTPLRLAWTEPGESMRQCAELDAVLAPVDGGRPCWQVRTLGPVDSAQRRAAVRVPLSVPVEVTYAGEVLSGTTLDLSEGGGRCVLPLAPAADDLPIGAVVPLVLDIGEVSGLALRAEVTRCVRRGDGLREVSLCFVDPPERSEDAIRRRVFGEMRDRRARGLD